MNKRQFNRLIASNVLNAKRNLMQTIMESEGKSVRYWLLRDECREIIRKHNLK